jgi:mRNA-degrading endonuclease RelE of RelBE toxin-antitoxin system
LGDILPVVIIETSVFTRQVRNLLDDDEYRKLQLALVNRPSMGRAIRGSGGLRKVRWALPRKWKRGGVRVIYYWAPSQAQILMLMMYSKREQEGLTSIQLKILRKIVQEEFK